MMKPTPFLLLGRRCGNFSRLSHQKLSYFSTSSSSTSSDLVLKTIDEDAGIAMLTMNRPSANSLSLELNTELCNSIKEVESNPKIQSVILASSNPKIFSAGNDISELVSPDADRLPKFWNSLQQICIDLYGSRIGTVAAIQGHAPAAGCFLAMACDYRIMSTGHDVGGKRVVPTIGMNETKLGIAAPFWMGQMLVRTIGNRQAELALAMGTMFPPEEALGVGLVDEIVSSQQSSSSTDESDCGDALLKLLPSLMKDQVSDPVLLKAYAQAKLFAKIPSRARLESKLVTREEPIQDLIVKREEDTESFCAFVMEETVQRNLNAYFEALKNRSKKK
mmetsp:Transcript_5591/g.12177  ORF Transcript_5591/g.12177 Transcript_5591/m.12177 type:complete len:334 (-) Transcript_5591:161-1162(-)